MFKYDAFTEDSLEMRAWLDKLGYKPSEDFDLNSIFRKPNLSYISLQDPTSLLITSGNDATYRSIGVTGINCRSNPSLFKAVTAIREDSDYMQWFVCGEIEDSVFLCESYDNVESHIHNEMDGWDISNYHKATLEELQEHFKAETPQKR